MPWALVGGLGEAGAAALLALLCIAIVYLLRAIAAVLPRINLVVATVDLGKIFSDITSPVVAWLVGATNELWSDAEWWMRGIAYVATAIFDDVKGALQTDAAFIAHLYNEVIPAAASHAQGTATNFTTQETKAITNDISSVHVTVDRALSRELAQQWVSEQHLTRTTKSALLATIGATLIHAEHYTDTQLHTLARHLQGEIGAAAPRYGAPPVAIPGPVAAPVALPSPVPVAVPGIDVGALATTVAATATAVATLTAEFESCAVTSCAGPNTLSSLLNGILGFVSLAEIAAFIAEIINSPAAAERKYAGYFQSLLGTGTTLLDDLLAL